jgi:hypothetical protein
LTTGDFCISHVRRITLWFRISAMTEGSFLARRKDG